MHELIFESFHLSVFDGKEDVPGMGVIAGSLVGPGKKEMRV